MKKTILLFFAIIRVLTASAAFAENAADTCVYEPDIKDETKFIRTCWFYDDEGQKIISPSSGYAGKTDVYVNLLDVENRYEHVMRIFMDPEGNLMAGPGRYAKMTTEHVVKKCNRVCRDFYERDDPNNYICGYTIRYFDENGDPVMIRNEDGFEGFRYHDPARGESGIIIDVNEYLFGEGGYASMSVSMVRTFTEYVHRYSYFGVDGEPVLRDGVYASYERKNTSLTDEIRFYGTDGELVDTPLGYACRIYTFSEGRSEYVIRFYDAANQPTTDAEWGVHAIHYYSDPYLTFTRIEYLNPEDNLTNNNKGYSTLIEKRKTTNLHLISKTFYDKEGKKVEIND